MKIKVPCTVCKSSRYLLANSYGICRKCERRYEYVVSKIAKRRGSPIDFLFRDKYKEVLNALTLAREREPKAEVQRLPDTAPGGVAGDGTVIAISQ